MSDEPYMNGIGIMAHTRKLIDDSWNAFPFAVAGGASVVLSIWSVVIASVHQVWWFTIFSVIWLIVAWLMYGPWVKAFCALHEHRHRMEAETAKRGDGWASS